MHEEIYVSVDIETSGPIPGEYSMLSLGACVIGNIDLNYYVELKPINNNSIPAALKTCGLGMDVLKATGTAPSLRVSLITMAL